MAPKTDTFSPKLHDATPRPLHPRLMRHSGIARLVDARRCATGLNVKADQKIRFTFAIQDPLPHILYSSAAVSRGPPPLFFE
jgi:hypothetical protein